MGSDVGDKRLLAAGEGKVITGLVGEIAVSLIKTPRRPLLIRIERCDSTNWPPSMSKRIL